MATIDINQLTLELLESLVELDGPIEALELWATLESTEVPPASLPLLDWVVGRVRRHTKRAS